MTDITDEPDIVFDPEGISEGIQSEATNIEEVCLFRFKMEFYTREFIGQKANGPKDAYECTCNNIAQFKANLWPKVCTLIKREIVFDDDSNSYKWGADEPEFDDLEKFILFQDKKARKSFRVDEVTNKKLQSWTSREENPYIKCFVQVYGNFLCSKGQFTDAFNQLLKPQEVDRANAATNFATFELAKELKQIHGSVIQGKDIAWYQFANFILSAAPHQHEELKRTLPPAHIIRFFELAKENAVQQMETARKAVAIGTRINKGVQTPIQELDDTVDIMIGAMETGLSLCKVLKQKVTCLKNQTLQTDNLMDGVAQSLGVELDSFARELQERVINIEDQDHAEVNDVNGE
uniref:CSON011796 protein n=1 Tax=Culicoides sonorensis TaxID=179676 RepID=A0A336N4T4_CULSO